MLAKLIPLAIVGALGVKGMSLAKDQMSFISDFPKIATTQSEVSAIKKLMVIEQAATGGFPGDWEEVVRSQVNSPGRDPCVDVWGSSYSVWAEEDVVVGSAGPDASFDTDDDILTK